MISLYGLRGKLGLLVISLLCIACSALAQVPLTLTQPTYLCSNGFIAFNIIGGDGTTITYSTTGITQSSPNSTTGVVEEKWRTDPMAGPVIIQATQGNVTVSYLLDVLTYCSAFSSFLKPLLRSPIPDITLTLGEPSPSLNVGQYFKSNNIGYDYRALFSYKAFGLPPGLSLNTHPGTPPGTVGTDTAYAYVSGTPTTLGVYQMTIIATNQGAFTAPYSAADTVKITVLANSLPVVLTSFTAKPYPNRGVELAWSTTAETNHKGFLIERSKDLNRFQKVGEVGKQETIRQGTRTYNLLDTLAYKGTSYYRLTQIDVSGKSKSYPIISVVLRDEAYTLMPNPVRGNSEFILQLDEPETAAILLFGADGRAIAFKKIRTEPGRLALKFIGHPPAGLYLLSVQERGQIRRHRLLVE